MSKTTVKASTGKIISVLVVVDTEQLLAAKLPVSIDPKYPTNINDASLLKKTFFMVAGNARGITGQGTNDLEIKANAGDIINFVGTTVEENGDDAVIIYNVTGGTSVLNDFISACVNRPKAVQPSAGGNGLPAVNYSRNFMTLESKVKAPGTANLLVNFALYRLSPNGQEQVLYGYYKYDPKIIVG
ncbi:AidA/PixA family protein [Fluviicola taffensis]|uniref:AidA/PixA family protein n=1 Tax=Fluviicola taffensis TaxID=191579 RepID=UPI0031381826